MVGRIATGEIEDNATAGAEAQREGGKKGGAARAAALTPEQRAEIAKKGAAKRWETT
jgi:general stress protein YciG